MIICIMLLDLLEKPMLECMLSRIGRHKIKHWVIDDYLSDIRSLGYFLDINALIVIMQC